MYQNKTKTKNTILSNTFPAVELPSNAIQRQLVSFLLEGAMQN